MTRIIWPEDAVKYLRERVAAGARAATIASELRDMGHIYSRNAVIGKSNRLKLVFSSSKGCRPAQPAGERKARQRKTKLITTPEGVSIKVRADAPVPVFTEIPSVNPVSILQLDSKTCRWPTGGFADRPPFLYCGDPTLEGCSYCARHTGLSQKGASKETNRAARQGAHAA